MAEKSGWDPTEVDALEYAIRIIESARPQIKTDPDNADFNLWVASNYIKNAVKKLKGEPE